ncbi:MAG: acylneuraminate cytidylyltransferase family protein [Spirochaetia bacterium]|nr:acylneuraminate cytidylyltransferase family protein [Spirochaetia bacterium]
MYEGKTFLAVIPARGGSKRLPGKNIADLGGKPLIAWTIEAAKSCKYIDKVIVSTDDSFISSIAKDFGAETPFVRPRELSTDQASSVDVVNHAINFYSSKNQAYDYNVLLQPTSPFRTGRHIKEAIELLNNDKVDGVISVCPVDHSPLWSNTLPDDLSMDNFLKAEIMGKRSQDLPAYYRINGAIYINNVERLINEKTFFFTDLMKAYIMERIVSIDIDESMDLTLARCIIANARNI